MMKINKKVLLLIALVGLFYSCETEIDMDLNSNSSRLVVEGNVLAGLDTIISTQTLKLTITANYTGITLPENVKNAVVQVDDGANTYLYTNTGNGIYQSNFVADANKIYTLKIIYNDEEYEASKKMNMGPVIDSLGTKYLPASKGSPEGDYVVLNSTDPADKRNFYLWQLYINGQFMINPSPGNIYRAIQQDEFFNGVGLTDYLPFDNFHVISGDKVVMHQLNISEVMYNYYYSLFNITSRNIAMGDVPPGNIKGNVINKDDRAKDALGYFGACTVSIKKMNIP